MHCRTVDGISCASSGERCVMRDENRCALTSVAGARYGCRAAATSSPADRSFSPRHPILRFAGPRVRPRRQEKGDKSVKPVVFLVGADKGGVGKTTIMRTLLDYLPTPRSAGASFREIDRRENE